MKIDDTIHYKVLPEDNWTTADVLDQRCVGDKATGSKSTWYNVRIQGEKRQEDVCVDLNVVS